MKLLSLPFYIASIKRMNTAQKLIVTLLADCVERGPPFRPSLPALAELCSCSRRHVWKALQGLETNDWIVADWRGGQRTNVYLPGWRLKRIIQRYRRPDRNAQAGKVNNAYRRRSTDKDDSPFKGRFRTTDHRS